MNGKQFVAVGSYGAVITSNDGTNWLEVSEFTETSFGTVSWDGKQFIAEGCDLDKHEFNVFVSEDGTLWAKSFAEIRFTATPYKGRYFFIDGGRIYSPENGDGWVETSPSVDCELRKIIWNGNKFLGVGSNWVTTTSDDGVHWKQTKNVWIGYPAVDAQGFNDVVWDGKKYVAVGFDGFIVESPDGEDWTIRNSSYQGIDAELNSVAFSGKAFVAVGTFGAILFSQDGEKWEVINAPKVPKF